MPISRVIFNGHTLMDLSEDTVTKPTLFQNTIAHTSNGSKIVGDAVPVSISGFYVDENGILHLTDDE